MLKAINYKVQLLISKDNTLPVIGNIVSNGNILYKIINFGESIKYKTICYCRSLKNDNVNIYRPFQLRNVAFTIDIYNKCKYVGNYLIDEETAKQLKYNLAIQEVKGYIETYKRKARINDEILYPYKSYVVNVDYITNMITTQYETIHRNKVTLLCNDIITSFKLG